MFFKTVLFIYIMKVMFELDTSEYFQRPHIGYVQPTPYIYELEKNLPNPVLFSFSFYCSLIHSLL